MKAEELRLGNYIDFNGMESIIKEIDNQGVVVFIKETDETEWIDLFQFSPIPLTEEILLKCEFENEIDDIDGKMYNIYFVTNTDYLIEYFHSDKKYVFTDDMGLKVNIKYLHQLQNLYYALCGEELEIGL